jgi:hypothetical protein
MEGYDVMCLESSWILQNINEKSWEKNEMLVETRKTLQKMERDARD